MPTFATEIQFGWAFIASRVRPASFNITIGSNSSLIKTVFNLWASSKPTTLAYSFLWKTHTLSKPTGLSKAMKLYSSTFSILAFFSLCIFFSFPHFLSPQPALAHSSKFLNHLANPYKSQLLAPSIVRRREGRKRGKRGGGKFQPIILGPRPQIPNCVPKHFKRLFQICLPKRLLARYKRPSESERNRILRTRFVRTENSQSSETSSARVTPRRTNDINLTVAKSKTNLRNFITTKISLPAPPSYVNAVFIMTARLRAKQVCQIVWRRRSGDYKDSYFALQATARRGKNYWNVYYLGPRSKKRGTTLSLVAVGKNTIIVQRRDSSMIVTLELPVRKIGTYRMTLGVDASA